MFGAVFAYPFVLLTQRPIWALGLIIVGSAVMIGIDVGFAELGFDVLYGDPFSAGPGRFYYIASGILSTFIGAMAMSLALEHRGRRLSKPSLGDGIALWALTIWYGIAVIIPVVIVGAIVVGGASALSPEPFRIPIAVAAGAVLALPLIYVSVRLWFAGPRTLVDGRVHLFRSWPLTKGKFWAILGCALGAYVAAGVLLLIFQLALMFLVPPAPELMSWHDALTPLGLFHIGATEVGYVLATFYASAAQCFIFDRLAPAAEAGSSPA